MARIIFFFRSATRNIFSCLVGSLPLSHSRMSGIPQVRAIGGERVHSGLGVLEEAGFQENICKNVMPERFGGEVQLNPCSINIAAAAAAVFTAGRIEGEF